MRKQKAHISIQDNYFESLNNSQLSAERSKSPLASRKDKINMLVMPCAPVANPKAHRRSQSQNSLKSRNSTSPKPVNISKVLLDRQVETHVRDAYMSVCHKHNKQPSVRLLNNIKCSSGLISIEKASVNDNTVELLLHAIKRSQRKLAHSSFNGLSFSHNAYFKDAAMMHVISFMEN